VKAKHLFCYYISLSLRSDSQETICKIIAVDFSQRNINEFTGFSRKWVYNPRADHLAKAKKMAQLFSSVD